MFWCVRAGMPSGWIIDIWNCHGVLKPEVFAGYGNKSDEILKELQEATGHEYVWFSVGYYTIPIQKRILDDVKKHGLEEKLAEEVEKILNNIVYDINGGAINISGFYFVPLEELERLEEKVKEYWKKCVSEGEE